MSPALAEPGQASRSPSQFESTLADGTMLGSIINAASLAILSVDQNWTTLIQKGFHIAWQNGPVSLWRSLLTLETVRDHIKADCVKVVGTGVVGKADSEMRRELYELDCRNSIQTSAIASFREFSHLSHRLRSPNMQILRSHVNLEQIFNFLS